jgi:LuxR family transcriptional regulator, maltose regulon positive regulatory protein
MQNALVLKTSPPRGRRDILTRQRLLRKYEQNADAAVIVLQAPSGYGKTILLGQWRATALQGGACVAWLTVDREDEGARLLQGIAFAIAEAIGSRSFYESFDASVRPATDPRTAATALLAFWTRVPRRIVLVLDSAETLLDAGARAALAFLLENVPRNTRVMMATRPGRMDGLVRQAYGDWLLIDGAELAFTLEETLERMSARTAVSREVAVKIHELTEGWPAAVELSLASMGHQQSGSPHELALARRRLVDYFGATVRAVVSAPDLTRLATVSEIEPVHAALCTNVTGDNGWDALLRRVSEESNLLIPSTSAGWYRFHRLGKEYLRGEATPTAERHVASTHAKAALWFAGQRRWDAALRHAAASNDTQLIMRFIEDGIVSMLTEGKHDLLRECLTCIPEDEATHRPRLRLAIAWSLAVRGERGALAMARELQLHADPLLQAEACLIGQVASFHRDDPDSAVSFAPVLQRNLAHDSRVISGVRLNYQQWLEFVGAAPQGSALANERVDAIEQAPPFVRAISLHHQAVWLLENGYAALASELLSPMLVELETTHSRRDAPVVLLSITLAATLWEQGEPERMAALLADRLDLGSVGVTPECLWLGFVNAARLAEMNGEADRALGYLEDLRRSTVRQELPRLEMRALGELIRMHARAGRLDECERLGRDVHALLERGGPSVNGLNQPAIRIAATMALARIAWLQGDEQQARQQLEQVIELALRLGRRRHAIEARLFRSAIDLHGDRGEPDFREAITLGEALGLVRVFQEAESIVRPVICRQAEGLVGKEFLRRLQGTGADTDAQKAAVPHTAALVAMLTPSESKVLDLLNKGLINKEIARALDIGEQTVKWHLKNLFAKLEVPSRRGAVERARMLGLIER